jgi:hypothetical protein
MVAVSGIESKVFLLIVITGCIIGSLQYESRVPQSARVPALGPELLQTLPIVGPVLTLVLNIFKTTAWLWNTLVIDSINNVPYGPPVAVALCMLYIFGIRIRRPSESSSMIELSQEHVLDSMTFREKSEYYIRIMLPWLYMCFFCFFVL